MALGIERYVGGLTLEIMNEQPPVAPTPMHMQPAPLPVAPPHAPYWFADPDEMRRVTLAFLGNIQAPVPGPRGVMIMRPVPYNPQICSSLSDVRVWARDPQSHNLLLHESGYIDMTVLRTILASRPRTIVTEEMVDQWYAKNNNLLVVAHPDVRKLTARAVHAVSKQRADESALFLPSPVAGGRVNS
jgi:hypothetical protein